MPGASRSAQVHSILADIIGASGRRYTQTYPQQQHVPHQLVRGLVRGLLLYFSRPARRVAADQIHHDTLEAWLLAWIEEQTNPSTTRRARPTRTYTNAEVSNIANSVPEIVNVLLQHPSPLILTHESAWLTQTLSKYTTLPRDSRTRLRWVQNQLPRILEGLLLGSRCPRIDCPRRDSVPDRDELETWMQRAGFGVRALIFHILAHYHGSTYTTVQRGLQSRAPRTPRASRSAR